MKIRIDEDVFDITKRIKDFDEGYYIVFDTNRNVYELHNEYQSISYCLSIPYENLDSRVIDLLVYSNICNIDKIMLDIDTSNNDIERNSMNNVKNQADFMLREIYSFSSNSSKNLNANSFVTEWR